MATPVERKTNQTLKKVMMSVSLCTYKRELNIHQLSICFYLVQLAYKNRNKSENCVEDDLNLGQSISMAGVSCTLKYSPNSGNFDIENAEVLTQWCIGRFPKDNRLCLLDHFLANNDDGAP